MGVVGAPPDGTAAARVGRRTAIVNNPPLGAVRVGAQVLACAPFVSFLAPDLPGYPARNPMSDVFVHATATVDAGAAIGRGSRIWHYCHVFAGATLGEDCILGQNVMVSAGVRIGRGCKIQNNVSVYTGVTLEDEVFCGPSCVFTNVMTPRAFVERKNEYLPTLVRRGATIGANATVVCGVEIGAYALIGAGSVVTRNVPAYALMVGVPARRIGWVSRAGERLGKDLVCPRTGERYVEKGGELAPAG